MFFNYLSAGGNVSLSRTYSDFLTQYWKMEPDSYFVRPHSYTFNLLKYIKAMSEIDIFTIGLWSP